MIDVMLDYIEYDLKVWFNNNINYYFVNGKLEENYYGKNKNY